MSSLPLDAVQIGTRHRKDRPPATPALPAPPTMLWIALFALLCWALTP